MLITLASWAGLVTSVWLVLFQLLLAGGAPIGFLAWGGREPGRLSPRRRLASLASAAMMVFFALIFGQFAGLWSLLPDRVLFWGFAIGVGVFALSTLGNLGSSSKAERLLGVPVAAIMCASCVVLAFT